MRASTTSRSRQAKPDAIASAAITHVVTPAALTLV
jgi:hypothetical protein